VKRTNAGRIAALSVLAIVGTSNVLGSTVELVSPRAGKAIAAIGRVSLASPAPKVFCKMGGIEPFAREHAIELRYEDGTTASYAVDQARSIRLRGPYALRNVYGAAFVFAPLLPPRTTEAVVQHGLCEGMAFDTPLGDGLHGSPRSVVLTSSPRAGGVGAASRVEVACAH
jgi:hypothetical protein